MTLKFIQSRIDLAIVQCPISLTNTLEQQRLRVQLGVDSKNVQHDSRSGTIISTTDDVAIADDEDELALVVIIERSKRVDSPTERVLAFGVAWHLTKHKLVLKLRCALASELKSSQDYQA